MTPCHTASRSHSSLARWRTGLALPAAVILGLALASCGGAQHGGFQMPPVPVEVATVREGPVLDQFRALGTVEAREIVQVVNEVNGVVRSLPFAEGQSVVKGALLARLDDAEIKAEAQRAEALRDQAGANHERAKKLAEQGAVSAQELDNASAAFKVAEANYAVARVRFEKTRIRSPLTGVVGRRLVSPGAFLSVGETITEVAAVDLVKITFAAPERYLGLLRPGAKIEVSTPAYPGETFEGRVRVVDPILDSESRTVRLVAEVPNRGRRLKPGMSADVTATLAERARALTVPDEAVFAQGEQSFVFVVKPDSSVARQAVFLGTRDSSRAEITRGLAVGDVVVRAGYQKLFDGAKVMPIPEGDPSGAAPASGAGARAAGGKS